MALIGCPECHKRISESALGCPHCGYMLTPEVVTAQKEEQARIAEADAKIAMAVESESRMYKWMAIFATVIILGPIIVAALVNGVDWSPSKYSASQPTTDEDGRFMWRLITGQQTAADRAQSDAQEAMDRARSGR